MEQAHFWATNTSAADKEISHLLTEQEDTLLYSKKKKVQLGALLC